jgi:hypothetical protein
VINVYALGKHNDGKLVWSPSDTLIMAENFCRIGKRLNMLVQSLPLIMAEDFRSPGKRLAMLVQSLPLIMAEDFCSPGKRLAMLVQSLPSIMAEDFCSLCKGLTMLIIIRHFVCSEWIQWWCAGQIQGSRLR